MRKTILIFLIMMVIFSLLMSCVTEAEAVEDEEEDTVGIPVTITVDSGNVVYFSFTNGTLDGTADAATQNWDLCFSGSDNKFTANGGDTAVDLSSDGQVAVEFTGSTDLSITVDPAAYNFTDSYEADTKVWYYAMGDKEGCLNVMTYYGYETGDGTSGNPYKTIANTEAAYCVFTSSKTYEMTKRVYLVRHADGTSYSKLQMTNYEKVDSTRIYQLKYINL